MKAFRYKETKIYYHDAGHMTKMAATPIYGKKNFKNLLRNRRADFQETWYVASGLQPIIVCSNDDPGVTLTYFTARSNLVTKAFLWEKVKQWIFQKLLQPVT